MSDILPIERPMRRNNIAQDAPGTIFSRGAATLVSPFFDHASPRRVFRASTLLEHFERWKTVWTLPSLWTQRTRPQGTWKTAQTAVFHSVHTDHFFLQEETEERRTLQVCQSDCLNRGVHPRPLCPRLCPRDRRKTRRFPQHFDEGGFPKTVASGTARSRSRKCHLHVYLPSAVRWPRG